MRKTRSYAAGLSAALVMLLLTGCGGSASTNSAAMDMAVMETTMAYSPQMDGGLYAAAGEVMEAEEGALPQSNAYRKLIKTVSMDAETEEFDGLMAKLEGRVNELSGYIENSNVSGNSRYNESRYANLTIRIPQEKLDDFVNQVAELSNITWKSESVDDITLTYVDIESRKKALEVEQQRLLELLEQAATVEDIISIESRLSQVRYELQSYASQLLVYDNQVNYSTVHLNISEVRRLTPQAEPTVWERIATGFADNLGGVATMLENLFVGVIVLIPYWGTWLIIVLVLVVICKGISAAQKKKKAAKEKKE